MAYLIRFFSFPDSPVQRMGALGLASSILIFVWTAVDWQMSEGFIRRSTYQIEASQPEDSVEGHRWQRDAGSPNTWRLVEESCMSGKQDMLQPGSAEALLSQAQLRLRNCTRKEMPGYAQTSTYRLTVREYLQAIATVGPYHRTYGSYAGSAGLLFALASFAYFGFMDRLFCWIRTGRL
jgi:hypothetical protein